MIRKTIFKGRDHKKRILSCLMGLFLGCFQIVFIQPIFAAEKWEGKSFSHFSQNEPLIDVLQSFSSGLNMPIQFSEKAAARKDVVNAKFEHVDADNFLKEMESLYRITWYFDGNVLYIYNSDEVRSDVLHLNYLTSDKLKKILQQLGVYDDRFQWKNMQSGAILFVSGPPRYVELVLSIARLHDETVHDQRSSDFKAKIFPLKYAWAGDRTIAFREREVTIPGVATTLKRILGVNRNGSNGGAQPAQQAQAKSGLSGLGKKGDSRPELDASYESSLQGQSPYAQGMVSTGAYIEANTFQNSVIVYDLASRLEMYAELIAGLDVPMEQLEIEVSIMDVNTTRLSDLGVDWRYQKDNSFVDFGSPASLPFGAQNGVGLNFGDVLNPNAILARGGDHLLGRVRLLSQEGDGQVLSQPKVLTMNNVEAVIDNSTTFYVKLEGKEDVSLVPISVGTILRVNPRIVQEVDRRQISLDVIIEDGQVDDTVEKRVDDLPRVNKTTINTQAVIDENDSLLVGGYFYDAQSSTNSKVPFLGDAPLKIIRTLFSNEKKNRKKIARLFMITPRIISGFSGSSDVQNLKKRIDRSKSFDDLEYRKPSPILYD